MNLKNVMIGAAVNQNNPPRRECPRSGDRRGWKGEMKITKEMRAYLAEIGRRGGAVKSPKKTAAVRNNAKRPRKLKK